MRKGVSIVQVRRQRGKVTVQTLGRTPRGTKFILDQTELECKSPADKKFKGEMKAAVEQMLS